MIPAYIGGLIVGGWLIGWSFGHIPIFEATLVSILACALNGYCGYQIGLRLDQDKV